MIWRWAVRTDSPGKYAFLLDGFVIVKISAQDGEKSARICPALLRRGPGCLGGHLFHVWASAEFVPTCARRPGDQ